MSCRPMTSLTLFAVSLATVAVGAASAMADEKPNAAVNTRPVPANHVERAKKGTALFKDKVRAVLTEHCLDCHGGKSVKADFDLSTHELLMDSGFVGETADDSQLVQLITHAQEPHMPFKAKRMSDDRIELIRQWINLGAPYDKPLVEKTTAGPVAEMQVTDNDRQFWSFQKLQPVPVPAVDHVEWCQTPIDRFVLSKQEAAGLLPNAAADRRTLIRRATFDLLGLPATPEEVEAFVADESPEAWSKVLNRLLASPHYGERWARHWMDVARFAESHGYEQDYDRPHAYHYRDFLIKAFNEDMPFRQFLQWQLAGDEVAPENPLALMATGFLGAGAFPTQLTETEFESARYDELDDMVTTTGVTFLGLSVGCARCHDHKFDPIPARDYYRMAATFTTAIRSEIELDLQPEQNQQRQSEWDAKLAELQTELHQLEQSSVAPGFRKWLTANDASVSTSPWETLNVLRIDSTGGTKFTAHPDGSWLATGNTPAKEVLTVVAESRRPSIVSLRLEALTHESLPQKGPGRAPNGNFALGDIKVAAAIRRTTDKGAETATTEFEASQPVALQNAQATHQQNADTLSVAASIDGDPVSGWAIDAGGVGKDQAAVFQFAAPVASSAGTRWTITLNFSHPNAKHTAGRLRFSVSDRGDAPVRVGSEGLDPKIADAIQKAKSTGDEKSDAWKTAQAWFATTLPDWQAAKLALDQHVKKGAELQKTKVMVTSEGLPHMTHHADGRGFPHFYPETHLLTRGDVHQKKEVVQAGFLQVLQPNESAETAWKLSPPSANSRTSFRRATLANWMTDTDRGAGSIVARVIVNRLWQHHFGRGLVATPNDFGISGERPSHPELLDWLAMDLIQHDWQLKRLHHLIMSSSVYLQTAEHDESRATIDRENVLLWRWTPRRLEAEAIRDSMLAVSGKLDRTMFGPGTLDQNMARRSVYFFIKRSQLIPVMMLFDWPEHLVSIGQRSTTTIAPQALMFLNSKQGRDYSTAFAARLSRDSKEAAVSDAYRTAFARSPTSAERELATTFLVQQEALYQQQNLSEPLTAALTDLCQALMSMNEFVYME